MARERANPLITDFDNIPAEALVPEDEQPYEIPVHWKWVRLGRFCEYIQRGKGPKYVEESSFKAVSQKCVRWGGLDIAQSRCWDESSFLALDKIRILRVGDLLWNSTGTGTVGRVVQLSLIDIDEAAPMAADSHVTVIRTAPLLNGGYLLEFLSSEHIQSRVESELASGTTNQKELNLSTIKMLPIPLPPIDEQKAIVGRLQATSQKIDDVLERLGQFLDQAPQHRAAIIQAGVTGALAEEWRLANKVCWPSSETTKLFDFVTSGSRGWSKYYSDTGAMFLRMGNLTRDSIDLDLSGLQRVELPEKVEGRRSQVASGDLLISITADVGHVALIRGLNEVAYINQHLALARPAAHVLPEFLAWYLRAPVGIANIRAKQRGATKTGLGLEDIRSLAVELPEPEEQAEIVRRLRAALEQLNQACNCVVEASGQLINAKRVARSLALRGGS